LRENFDRFNFAIHKEKEMADFRRWILAFAALVLVLGSVAPASAQVTCNASAAVIPTLRHEGFTELTGDILLTCTAAAGVPQLGNGAVIPQATVSVSLSAPVTSRILGTASAPAPNLLSEALLLVNDPGLGSQVVCSDPTNPAVACQGIEGTTLPPNVYEGLEGSTSPGPNTVTFFGIPADPPATTRTYRITNIRVDATTVALGAGVGGTAAVYAFVSVSPSTAITINNGGQFVVGEVSYGLRNTAPSSAGATLFQCENFSGTLGSVTFTENFSTAFKTRGASGSGTGAVYPQNTPGVLYNTESGLELALPGGGEAGAADAPTQLEVTIANIPVGAVISVDPYAISTAQALCSAPCVSVYSYATLAASTSYTPPVDPTSASTSAVTVADNSKGTAPISVTVVWQIAAANSSAIDQLTFNIYGALVAQPSNPIPTTPATVAMGFYPQTATYPDSDSTGPIPSFSSTVEAQTPSPTNLFSISSCETILLFPYVTDFYGFDTGIAISNTSMDSLPSGQGAVGQTGTCTVAFYGAGGVASTLGTTGVYSSTGDTALTNGMIAPGQTWAFSLSGIDAGYNSTATYGTTGYAIATCNFQYAHGYSFVSDTGIRNFAAAYLALIIPDTVRRAQPFTCSENGGYCSSLTGEQLVH
jgi:hypothetical protein